MQNINKPPDLGGLPQQFPHIFLEIAWPIIPEVSYGDLVYLSQLIKQSGKEKSYESLVDCLRKIQWAKIAGQEVIEIERQIAEQITPNAIPFFPVGQVSKSLFDFIANGKASLDSLAVFLNSFLNLGKKGGERDFRQTNFYQTVYDHDNEIGQYIKSQKNWLDKGREFSDSIIATRDEWLHRGRPEIVAIYPPTEFGFFPIRKSLASRLTDLDIPITSEHYWKTSEFIDFHLQRLFSLFSLVVNRCIVIEEKIAPKKIDRNSLPLDQKVAAFPFKATKSILVNKIKLHL